MQYPKKHRVQSMNWRGIIINPLVFTGKSVIKGTRLAVEFILDLLAHDWTETEIIQNCPGYLLRK